MSSSWIQKMHYFNGAHGMRKPLPQKFSPPMFVKASCYSHSLNLPPSTKNSQKKKVMKCHFSLLFICETPAKTLYLMPLTLKEQNRQEPAQLPNPIKHE